MNVIAPRWILFFALKSLRHDRTLDQYNAEIVALDQRVASRDDKANVSAASKAATSQLTSSCGPSMPGVGASRYHEGLLALIFRRVDKSPKDESRDAGASPRCTRLRTTGFRA